MNSPLGRVCIIQLYDFLLFQMFNCETSSPALVGLPGVDLPSSCFLVQSPRTTPFFQECWNPIFHRSSGLKHRMAQLHLRDGRQKHFSFLSPLLSRSPLAQNQYMGFKVVLSKPLKMTNKQKYLCKAHNCVQNLGGAHISNVIFLILLLLFCCFMCVGIPTHVKYNAIFLIFPISQNWVCAS